MDVQKRIKDLMELRGWTDYRLAKEAGLSHSTVTNMSIAVTLRLCRHWRLYAGRLAITLSQFFEDFEDNETLQEQRRYFQSGAPLPKSSENLLDLMDIIK